MSKHTPGPWRVWSEKDDDGRITVLEVCETQDRGRHSHFASVAKHWPEAEANARLISAAPDLLAALIACEHELLAVLRSINTDSVHFDGDEFHERLKASRAAIAKAEGVTA